MSNFFETTRELNDAKVMFNKQHVVQVSEVTSEVSVIILSNGNVYRVKEKFDNLRTKLYN